MLFQAAQTLNKVQINPVLAKALLELKPSQLKEMGIGSIEQLTGEQNGYKMY